MKHITHTISKLLLASTLLAAPAAFAVQDSCIAKTDYEAILSKFRLEKINDQGEVEKVFDQSDRCKQPEFSKYMDGFSFLYKLPRFTKTPSRLQTLISKEGPVAFLEKRIQTMKFETDSYDTCSEGAAAFVSTHEREDKIMHFCPMSKTGAITTPLLVSQIMLHEARHIDGFLHVNCVKGEFSQIGFPACDNNYQEQGSYGIGAGYYFYVYKGTKNEAIKDEARSMAVRTALSNFVKPPLDITSGAILLGADNNVYFNNGKMTNIGSFENEINVLIATHTSYLFFKDGRMAAYDFSPNWYYYSNSVQKYYANLSQSERDSLLDVKTTAVTTCFLWPKYMQCLKSGTSDFEEIRFSTIDPLRFFESDNIWFERIQILDKSGKVYVMAEDFSDMMAEADTDYHTTRAQYENLSGWAYLQDGTLLGLSKTGYLMRKTEDKWVRAKEFNNQKYQKIYPFMWSKTLEDL